VTEDNATYYTPELDLKVLFQYEDYSNVQMPQSTYYYTKVILIMPLTSLTIRYPYANLYTIIQKKNSKY